MDGREALAALNEEWRGLADQPNPWRSEAAIATADDLAQVLELVSKSPDAVLAALLRLGHAGDRLAHRTVLQTMLGKAVVLTAGRPELLAEAISELWVAIAEYPLERRPRSIATNLAWTLRRRLARPSPVRRFDFDPVAVVPDPDARQTLDEALNCGLIDDPTYEVLWTVYVAGLSSRAAASALGTTAETVRWRCSRALRHLAMHAELLAA